MHSMTNFHNFALKIEADWAVKTVNSLYKLKMSIVNIET